jgi:hypothetical protein
MALNLPTSPRTSVFRALEKILRNDPVLHTAIKPQSFRSWTGDDLDDITPSIDMCPFLRMTPACQAEMWEFPDAQQGMLLVNVELMTPGYNVCDMLDLWWAIEKAIYPSDFDLRNANVNALNAAGAYPGTPQFSQPAFDPKPESQFLVALGQISIKVLLALNP